MNLNTTSSSTPTDKWQKMLAIVNQHPSLIQPKISQQFKKLRMLRLFSENFLLFLFQYIGLMLMDGLTAQSLVPFWFSSGTACAFIFLRGKSILPGIFLGSFYAYFITTHQFLDASINASLDSIQALFILFLSYRYLGPSLVFSNLKSFFSFIIYTSFVLCFTSLHTDLFSLLIKYDYNPILECLRWFLGNLGGILIFTLAILSWDLYCLQLNELKSMQKTLFLHYSLIVMNMFFLINSQTFFYITLFSLTSFSLVIYTSLKLKWCGTIAALFLCALILNLWLVLGYGLALNMLIYLQVLFITEAIVGLGFCITNEGILLPQTIGRCV